MTSAAALPQWYEPVFTQPPSAVSSLFFQYWGGRSFIVIDPANPDQVKELYKLTLWDTVLRVVTFFSGVVPVIALICTYMNYSANKKRKYQVFTPQPSDLTKPPQEPPQAPSTPPPSIKPSPAASLSLTNDKPSPATQEPKTTPDYIFPSDHPQFPNARYYGSLSTGKWESVPAGQPFGDGSLWLSESEPHIEKISGSFRNVVTPDPRHGNAIDLSEIQYRDGNFFKGHALSLEGRFVPVKGMMHYTNGDIFQGHFKNGQPIADVLTKKEEGTFFLKNGLKIYTIDLEEGMFKGFVQYEYYHTRYSYTIKEPLSLEDLTEKIFAEFSTKCTYKGDTDTKGKYHGQGQLSIDGKLVFKGIWQDGEMLHGALYGCAKRTSVQTRWSTDFQNFTYTGHFKDNQMDTTGSGIPARYEDSNGVYTGSFKADQMDTGDQKATYFFGNGDKYEGSFKAGMMDTTGAPRALYTYADGDTYEGDFIKGKRDTTGKKLAVYKKITIEDGVTCTNTISSYFADDYWAANPTILREKQRLKIAH